MPSAGETNWEKPNMTSKLPYTISTAQFQYAIYVFNNIAIQIMKLNQVITYTKTSETPLGGKPFRLNGNDSGLGACDQQRALLRQIYIQWQQS